MNAEEIILNKMLLVVDDVIKDAVHLRDKIEKIKDDCAKLRVSQDHQVMAGVSTSALDYGISEAKMAKLAAHRSRVEAKRHANLKS